MAARLLTLMLVPTLYLILEDLRALVGLAPSHAVEPVVESD